MAGIKHCIYCLAAIFLAGLLSACAFGFIAPADAGAYTSVQLEITGDGVANPVTFTLEQLQGMEQYQHVYSTINTWPTKNWYTGKGVKLRDLLAAAGIKPDARMITFTSTDGYSVTLTVKELLEDPRYYFPGLQENSASDGSIPGSQAGAQEVETILALLSAEGSSDPADMNDMYTLLLICGQRAITEQTNTLFLKYVNKIEVLNDEPPQWDKPKVNVDSGEVAAGTLLELSSKSSDVDKVYFTTDGSTPTINSPMFNWSAKRWWDLRPDSLSSINKAIEIREDTVIKAITIGPGKYDSEVVTFTYKIGEPEEIEILGGPPTSVALDEKSIRLRVGGSFELAATVGPNNAVDRSVTWRSSDTSVAVVDNNGLVTVVGAGSAVVTVETVSGGLTDNCLVTGLPASKDEEDEEYEEREENEEKANLVEPPVWSEQMQPPADPDIPATQSVDSGVEEDPAAERQAAGASVQYLASIDTSVASTTNPDRLEGEYNWQVFEVTAEPVTLDLPVQPDYQAVFVIIIFVFLFLSGAFIKYREYMKGAAG
ncbi:MAG: FN3 associated domain-containing protein [Desulfotomaculaceae bacterium]|nr:FN3 associated domain-containing protein [Desulfotomaculaceae bacterium]